MNYQEAIKQAIGSIEPTPYRPNAKTGRDGVSQDIYWQGKLLLEASSPPYSMCVGAVGEAITEAFRLLGLEDIIPYKDMVYMHEWGFIKRSEDWDGYPGAIAEMQWGEWVFDDEIQYGDIAQYWHEDPENKENRTKGHAVIITGKSTYKGKPVFKNWSSSIIKHKGHTDDWHLVENKLKTGHERIWYVARPNIEFIKKMY